MMKNTITKRILVPALIFLPITLIIAYAVSGPILDRWYAANLKVGMASSDEGFLKRFKGPRPLPDLHFIDSQGHKLTLEDFEGKVLLLNIWATWCLPCRQEMPALDRLKTALGNKDFEVIALSTDEGGRTVVEAFYEEIGIKSLGIYWDPKGRIEKDLAIFAYPTTFLLDRQGRALGTRLGAVEWDSDEVVTLIQEQISAQGPADQAANEKGLW
jgi:thiol-disulfide isomerase/thioredoxin